MAHISAIVCSWDIATFLAKWLLEGARKPLKEILPCVHCQGNGHSNQYVTAVAKTIFSNAFLYDGTSGGGCGDKAGKSSVGGHKGQTSGAYYSDTSISHSSHCNWDHVGHSRHGGGRGGTVVTKNTEGDIAQP